MKGWSNVNVKQISFFLKKIVEKVIVATIFKIINGLTAKPFVKLISVALSD